MDQEVQTVGLQLVRSKFGGPLFELRTCERSFLISETSSTTIRHFAIRRRIGRTHGTQENWEVIGEHDLKNYYVIVDLGYL